MKSFGKIFVSIFVSCIILTLVACGNKAIQTNAKTFDKTALVNEINSMLTEPKEPDAKELTDVYNIDSTLFKDSIIVVDKDYNFCMMLLPAEGKSNDVKNMMSTSLTQLAQQLELYMPEQCSRVNDRLETMRGDYLIYAATPDNNKLLTIIESAIE